MFIYTRYVCHFETVLPRRSAMVSLIGSRLLDRVIGACLFPPNALFTGKKNCFLQL